MTETAYRDAGQWGRRLDHAYGDRVHLLADPWSQSLAARISHPETALPLLHHLVETAYGRLFEAASELLPRKQVSWPTRMTAAHADAAWAGEVIDPDAEVVLVDVARAGMIPSYLGHRLLLNILHSPGVRVDHVFMQRVSDAAGRVTGVDTSGSKIGGPVAGATVIIPDPMAATGSSMSEALALYRGLDGGPPATMAVLHLMVTPEYVRRITTEFPEVHIYALRMDRGRSSQAALAAPLGARWDEESGLDDTSYIVPGAGGVGELLNNTPN
jgi:uracil phosphoribosyltransferase